MKEAPLVSIKCLVYNHEAYLRQCLDGIVMQQTDFPFEAIVHDDASTDGSAAIIREYAEKYPDIIKPIYEPENQYSKKGGSISRIINDAIHPDAKYIALCEGDDYWTDPKKLQRQADFLESHPDYTMCCNRTKLYSETQHIFIGENYCYTQSQDILVKDIINRTGLFISTCSILYRRGVKDDWPDYCQQCAVGDYPLQIMCAMKGKTYYFNEIMSAYRVDNPDSWMGGQKWNSISNENLKRIQSMVVMFEGFAKELPRYASILHNKIAQYINCSYSLTFSSAEKKKYYEYFKDYIDKYSRLWKWDFFLRTRTHTVSHAYRFIASHSLLKKYKYRTKYTYRTILNIIYNKF